MRINGKRTVAFTLVVALTIGLVACGAKDDGKTATSQTTTEPSDSTQQTTTAAQQADTQKTTQSSESKIHQPEITEDLRETNNEVVGTGANIKDRDENNVPNGYKYYMSQYSDYGAHFLMDTNEKTIYLTSDEGYETGNTPKILQTLKEKNVKMTFFVTQAFVDSAPELLQQMIDDGHTVGNHTIKHPSYPGMPGLSLEDQADDVLTLEKNVKDQFGYEMRYFRYPGGYFSQQSLALFQSMGFETVFWSFAYRDWDTENQPDPTVALDTMTSQLHPGAIYLLHAVSDTNTAVLGDFIDAARAQGYKFAAFGNENRY